MRAPFFPSTNHFHFPFFGDDSSSSSVCVCVSHLWWKFFCLSSYQKYLHYVKMFRKSVHLNGIRKVEYSRLFDEEKYEVNLVLRLHLTFLVSRSCAVFILQPKFLCRLPTFPSLAETFFAFVHFEQRERESAIDKYTFVMVSANSSTRTFSFHHRAQFLPVFGVFIYILIHIIHKTLSKPKLWCNSHCVSISYKLLTFHCMN